MREIINNKLKKLIAKILMKIKPKFSFHYIAYTILFGFVIFSVVSIVTATTPNPGHPWSELGDGVFVFSSGQTATPYTYTFPAANSTVLTTNAAVTVAQGGTGAGTAFTSGSIVFAGTSGVYSQDNAAFFINPTLNRLGIGTNTPTAKIDITQPTTGVGTVSNTALGTTVTGVGTQFTDTFKVGDTITIGGQTVAISAIASDTSMTTAAITNANTTVATLVTPGLYNNIILAIYILMFLSKKMILKTRTFGDVRETQTKHPLSFAIMRFFFAGSDREVMHKVTDMTGKYYCLIPNGIYYIKIENKNYDESYSLVHTSLPIEVKKGYINKRFEL